MRQVRLVVRLVFFLLTVPHSIFAQSPTAAASAVPRVVTITGIVRPVDGQPATSAETVTLSIYAESEGGTALWRETQTVAVDAQGRYTLLLGSTQADGIPARVLAASDTLWLGTLVERRGEVEGPRVRLTSVPYALRASDAVTLGGLPASAYLRAPTGDQAPTATQGDAPAPPVVADGTPNYLAKYVSTVDLANSALYETGGRVGVGTTVPLDSMHVQFTNTNGAFTGYAVQNLGGTATSYSGMLFYDQNGALGQFQGFNNSTHEYRINNIARVAPGGAFNGSINFMIGSTSRFLVASNGNIGIGTTSPAALLEVSNAVPGGPANMWVTSYTNAINPYYFARRARGTAAAPTAVQSGDGLSGFYGTGYGTTGFGSTFAGGMTVQAAQNWTDIAQGTALAFSTTSINTTTAATRMTLDASGNLGIGTTTLPAASLLEVSNAANPNTTGTAIATTYANAAMSLFIGRRARGTAIAPTAVQGGDNLVGYLAQGYGTSGFSGSRGGMFVQAAENWTNTAQGTRLNFNTTMVGTTGPATRMTIDPSGNVGIGTTAPLATLDMVSETPGPLEINLTRFAGTSSSGEPNIVLRTARGLRAAPSAVQAGDELGGLFATGYAATGFGDGGAGFGAFAAENWTDTAQGAALALGATPLGTSEGEVNLVVLPGGNVGIGTFFDFPVITDKLQVFGDIRIGTTGTNGCLKDFAGTGLVGSCSSDLRLKKNITPFVSMLSKVAALQPVHYFWRADEFPGRAFGTGQTYGLVAQDVEQVLPELVATDNDGFKTVDYSKLPLLSVQAIKELKEENDALKQRLSELERLITGLLANSPASR